MCNRKLYDNLISKQYNTAPDTADDIVMSSTTMIIVVVAKTESEFLVSQS
nr:unnamed protein product [Callosobruchus chinensis]